MHKMLEKVLEDTHNVSIPWVITQSDLVPPSMYMVASVPEPPSANASSGGGGGSSFGFRSSGPINRNSQATGTGMTCGASAGTTSLWRAYGGKGVSGNGGDDHSSGGNGRAVSPEAPPTLVGASGPLPSELAAGGRWFARTVGNGAILLTFLPSLDVWRKEVSKRLALRKDRRDRQQQQQQQRAQGPKKGPRMREGMGGDGPAATARLNAETAVGEGKTEKEKDDSLGLFLFLVRLGDFGLPIEPQSAMLRDVRRILLAHIPLSHHQAMAFKPVQR